MIGTPQVPHLKPASRSLAPANCQSGTAEAARANAAALTSLVWSPFRRGETGWEIYAPLVGREIQTSCAPDTPGFAQALARWQGANGEPADGVVSAATFKRMQDAIELRRPFVRLTAQNVCPDPPGAAALLSATPAEGYSGKVVQLEAGALGAFRRMAKAARAADPAIAADPRNLTLFSGFRSPADDAARCGRDGNCGGPARANCSAHRTGMAMDLYVGQAPGFGPDSSADANRLFMSRQPAYRWLVANADRFGFVPYPFEPWHWEWTGQSP
jgi:hypothetical protein